jgi:hypothetical protein
MLRLGRVASFDFPIGELQVVGDSRGNALLLLLGHGAPHAADEPEPLAQAHHDVEGEFLRSPPGVT